MLRLLRLVRGVGSRASDGQRLRPLFCLLAILACGDAAYPRLLHAEEDTAQFLTEYRAAVSRLAAECSHVQVAWNSVIPANDPAPPGAKPPVSQVNEYWSSGGRDKLRRVYKDPRFFESIVLRTNESSFQLRRASPTGAYSIAFTPISDLESKLVDNLRDKVVFSPFALGMAHLHEIVKSPEFMITEVSHDSPIAIKASFFHVGKRNGIADVTTSGWIRVNPRLNFALTEYDWTMESMVNGKLLTLGEKGTNVYANDAGNPVPSEIRIERLSQGGLPRKSVSVLRITKWTYQGPSLDEFSLDKYGLGDAVDNPAAEKQK